MAELTEENVETILLTCGGNTGALAESLSRWFGRAYRLEVGESGIWPPTPSAAWNGQGLVVLFQIGPPQGMAVLLPETLLPEWSAHPSDSEQARLETLSREWSLSFLPPDLPADTFHSLTATDLAQTIESMSPAEWAATMELRVFEADQESADPLATLLVVWPLEQPSVSEPELTVEASAAAAPSAAPPIPQGSRVDPFARLRHLPVEVSVRLAEKKIPMLQLLSITPGMLITFNKSCEDLLDLYINNSRYCRGEAVKIGENFGLKINQVGVPEETPHKVIDV